MLDTVAGDVRGHLLLAARVLSDVQPRSGVAVKVQRPQSKGKEN